MNEAKKLAIYLKTYRIKIITILITFLLFLTIFSTTSKADEIEEVITETNMSASEQLSILVNKCENWFMLEDTNGYRRLYVGDEEYKYMCIQDLCNYPNLVRVYLTNEDLTQIGQFHAYQLFDNKWEYRGDSSGYIDFPSCNFNVIAKSKEFTPVVNGTIVKSLPSVIDKNTSNYILSYNDSEITAWVGYTLDGCWTTFQENFNYYWLDTYSSNNAYPIQKYVYDIENDTWTYIGFSDRAYGWAEDVACVVGPSYKRDGSRSRLNVRGFLNETPNIKFTQKMDDIGENWFILEDGEGYRSLYVGDTNYEYMCLQDTYTNNNQIKVFLANENDSSTGKFAWYLEMGGYWCYVGDAGEYINYITNNYRIVAQSKEFTPYVNGTVIKSLPSMIDKHTSKYILDYNDSAITAWVGYDALDGCWTTFQENFNYYWLANYNENTAYPIYKFTYDVENDIWTYIETSSIAFGWAQDIACVVGPSYTRDGVRSRLDARNFYILNPEISEYPNISEDNEIGENWFIIEDECGGKTLYVGEDGYDFMSVQCQGGGYIKVSLINENTNLTGDFYTYKSDGEVWRYSGKSKGIITYYNPESSLIISSKKFEKYYNNILIESLPEGVNNEDSNYIISYYNSNITMWVAPNVSGCWKSLQGDFNYFWVNNAENTTAAYPVRKFIYNTENNTWNDEGLENMAYGWADDVYCIVGVSYRETNSVLSLSRGNLRDYFREISDEVENIDINQYVLNEKLKLDETKWGIEGINPSSGDYAKTYIEFALANSNVSLSRTYNSLNGNSEILGKGWRLSFDANIEAFKYDSKTFIIHLPNGNIDVFTQKIDGSFELNGNRNSLIFENNKYIYTDKNQVVYEYNGTTKKLEKVIDEFGNEIQVIYDVDNKINKIRDYAQREYTFEYNIEGTRLTQITDPIGRTVQYTYTDGLLTKVKNADGTENMYEYNENGMLVKIEQKGIYGTVSTINEITYIPTGIHANKVLSLESETGNTKTYSYDNHLRKTVETDINNQVREVYYDAQNAIIKRIEPNGAETIFVYKLEDGENKYGEIETSTDIYGKTLSYERDEFGNTTKQINPDNSTKQYWYNSKNKVIKEMDEIGHITEYIYDNDEVTLLKIVKPLNGVLEYSVDNNQDLYEITSYTYYNATDTNGISGLVRNVESGKGIFSYEYDQYGNISKQTDGEGNVTTYINNEIGWRNSEQTGTGYITEYEYNNAGDVIEATKGGNTVQQALYDFSNQVISVTNGNGNTEYKEYNAGGKITKYIDKEGNITLYQYDMYGNLEYETKPNGAVYKYEYDELNRLVRMSYQVDENSPYILLQTKTYSLDEGNLIINTKTYTSATEYKTKIEIFDYNDNLIREENDGRIKTITYLANGLKASETEANGATTYYYYTGNNKLNKIYTQIDNQYSYIEYEYDNLGNVIKEKAGIEKVNLGEFPTTYKETNYEYNTNAQLTRKTTTDGEEIAYQYDMYGNITQERVKINEENYSITNYEYNYMNKPTKKIVNGRVTLYEYDSCGNITKETTPEEIETNYSYNRNGKIVEKSINNNIIEQFTYDNMENVTSKTDGNNNTTIYEYDKLGNVVKETNALNGITTYSYDLIGRVIETKNPRNQNTNNRTIYTYDKYDNVVEKKVTYIENEETIEIITTWIYDAANNVIEQREPNNIVTTYEYNKANKVTTEIDGNGNETLYGYDVFLNNVEVTKPNGVILRYTYDNRNNVISEKVKPSAEADEILLEMNEYDLMNNNIKTTDANENVIIKEYNANGELVREVQPNTYEKIYTYNGDGKVTKIADNLDYEKIYEYDVFGNVTLEKEQKNDETQVVFITREYDVNGNKTKEIDANGNETLYEYNALNKLLKETNALNQETTYEYDANSNLTSETNFAGNTKVYIYDALDRLIEQKNELGQTIERLEYNNNGRQTKSIDALGKIIQYQYDALGNVLQKIDQEGNAETYAYDSVGNKISVKDKNENITTYEYDYANNLTKVVNALNQETIYEYDRNDNLVRITDAKNHSIEYTYDSMNNELSEKDALNNIEAKTYTLGGLQSSLTTRNGDTFTYQYDILGRLISETVNNVTTTYTYDNNDNLLSITRGMEVVTNTYDELNRLTRKQENGLITNYVYDIVNNVTGSMSEKITDAKGNEIIKEYDKAGRLIKVQNGTDITIYTYNLDGTTKSVTYSNGVVEEYTYNDDKTLLNLTNTNGNIVEEYEYEYDDNNNIKKKVDTKGITLYFYDAENKLTTVQTPSSLTTYIYDAVGNRTRETIGSLVREYTYNSKNQLISITESIDNTQTKVITYTYDDNGNQLEEKEDNVLKKSYEYNERNELIELTKDMATTTYTYNITGLRSSKQNGTNITKFVYDGKDIILELDSNNNQVAQNVYGLALISRKVGNTTGYYLYNGHGDVEEIVSGNGTSLNTYYYDEYGNIKEVNETMNNPFKYAGYYYDSESDNYYLQNRYYNPEIGIFISEDTYRGNYLDPLSLNRYVYVKQNPMIYVDPNGNMPILGDMLLRGGMGAAINILFTLIQDRQDDGIINYNPNVYIASGTVGFIGGVAGGMMSSTQNMGMVIAIGIGSKITSSAVEQMIITGQVNWKKVASDTFSYVALDALTSVVRCFGSELMELSYRRAVDYFGLNNSNFNLIQKQMLSAGNIDASITNFANIDGSISTPSNKKITGYKTGKPGTVYTKSTKSSLPQSNLKLLNAGKEITILEKSAKHIFRKTKGHFEFDTPENRKLLLDVANNSKNLMGIDSRNNVWYAKIQNDGTQLWVSTRNYKIINGGINQIPHEFDLRTGLSENIYKRWK